MKPSQILLPTLTALMLSALTSVSAGSDERAEKVFITPVRPDLAASLDPLMPLEEGWRNPPRISRTRVYWWWLNGNVTKEAITRDLEALKAKGYGGGLLIDASGDARTGGTRVPKGPLFASPEWTQLFIHAVEEAARLDLELGFNICSGWNLGGPLVPLEHASKKLSSAQTTVQGGQEVSISLPRPKSRENYYRDVAVVALPMSAPDRDQSTGTAAASSAQANYPATAVGDGNPKTFWVSSGTAPGDGPTVDKPQWLEVRFPEATRIDRVKLTPRGRFGPSAGRLEIAAGGGWKILRENLTFPDKSSEISFEPVKATALRLAFTDARDPAHPDNARNVQVAELALFDGKTSLFQGANTITLGKLKDYQKKGYHQYPGRFTAAPAWHLLNPGSAAGACPPNKVVNLTDRVKGGKLTWSAPAGSWRIIRLGYTYSGSHVKTSSEGWTGRSIDYLDPDAFDFYWDQIMEPLLAKVKPHLGKTLNFVHTDSWELGPINWTPKLPQEFEKRRGYDITPWLPALAGYVVESPEASTRFLNDFRATLADLINENKYVRFSQRAHAHGLGIHPESGGPHAAPFDALRNLGVSDIPMGEFWNRNHNHRVKDTQRFFVKQTASAAHVYGRRLCMAEAFTTIGPHWERSPRMLKHDFDRAVCEGHNLTMWHTFVCSPKEMGEPGQVYFAGTHANPQVTWWPMIDGFIGYMNRVQFIMQQGLAVSDVLYYIGENIPAFVRLKRDDPARVLPGYDYDVIDTLSLRHRLQVDADGGLTLPSGIRYQVLALPAHDAYDLPTLEKIAQLVEAGATVRGRRPTKRYGLSGDSAADQRFATLVEDLWGSGKITEKSTREVLSTHEIGPDFNWSENPAKKSKDHHLTIDYFHRLTTSADIYYVVNRLNVPRRITASFRQSGRQPELWNPVSGEIIPNAAFRAAGKHTELELEFPPEGSVFVVFRKPVGSIPPRADNSSRTQELQTLDQPWKVSFDPAWGPADPIVFDQLISWTEHPDKEIRYYSGIARYRSTFQFSPPESSGKDAKILLDLGKVKEVARVILNGRDLGVVWSVPARIDISPSLVESRNELVIEVANNWPNRLIGDQHLPEAERRTKTNYQKFKKDSPLYPSGLLGPVKLLQSEASGEGELPK